MALAAEYDFPPASAMIPKYQMIMKQGLPDFGQSVAGEGFIAFAPFEGIGNVTFLPLSLNIARDPNGRPAFELESVRSTTPTSLPKPHGLLKFQLALDEPQQAAVEAVREKWPRAPIVRPGFSQGFLRFRVKSEVAPAEATIAELQTPVELSGLSVSKIRLNRQLNVETLALLKKSLQDNLLLLEGFAELELQGVSPRVAATVEFNPMDLVRALEKLADAKKRVPVSKIFQSLKQTPVSLPVNVRKKAEGITPDEFAAAMTDWICASFGQSIPAPDELPEPHVTFQSAADVGKGKFTWDLSTPLVSSRIFLFKFDALQAARELVKAKGMNSVFVETVVPPLNTGLVRLTVTHELPAELPEGVVSAGVKINVPSNPPYRPQAINKTVVFEKNEDSSVVELRFSPSEKTQTYKYTTFVVVKDSRGTRELTGPQIQATGSYLNLRLGDFPLQFVPIGASMGILHEATVNGTCQWRDQGKEVKLNFQLTKDKPAVTLGLPENALETLTCSIEARAVDPYGVVKTSFSSFNNIFLDAFAFAEYGPHQVDIDCVFGNGSALFALELIPEGKDPLSKNVSVLSFTPEQPRRSWRWFADSPFSPGFLYRPYKAPGQEPEPWSAVQSPFMGKLEINLNKPMKKPANGVPKLEGDRDFEDVRYFQDSSDEYLFHFIPLQPCPQVDDQGSPTLLLMIAGEISMLQLSTQWQADSETMERLKRRIASENRLLEPALIRFNFAPVSVEKVELILNNGKEENAIAKAKSSNASPFTTIFSMSIPPVQKNLVVSSMHGKKDVFLVRYHASRETEQTVKFALHGDIRNARRDLNKEASPEECRVWLEDAIVLGRLTVEKTGDEQQNEQLWRETEEEVMQTAAAKILEFVRTGDVQPAAANFTIFSERSVKDTTPFFISTDVAEWFEGKKADDHIRIF